MPETGLVVRDDKGLTLKERKLLAEIALSGSWQEAADSTGWTRRQVQRLFIENESFKHEYDAMFGTEELEVVKRELNLVTSGSGKVFEDALNAEMTKVVHAKCPQCGHSWKIFVTVMDWTAKLRAGETLLKIANIFKETKDVKHSGNVSVVTMTITESLAIRSILAGVRPPRHILDDLRAKGLITPDLQSRLDDIPWVNAHDDSFEEPVPEPGEIVEEGEYNDVPS